MFGGLAFLIGGNIAVAASAGRLLGRAIQPGPTVIARRRLARWDAGRPCRWLRVDTDAVRTKRQLASGSAWARPTHDRSPKVVAGATMSMMVHAGDSTYRSVGGILSDE